MFTVHRFTFNPFEENTYILTTETNKAVLVDPGNFFPQETQTLVNFIQDNNLELVQILQTHCHLDHVFGLTFCTEKYGLQPWLHAAEQIVLDRAGEAGQRWGIPFDAYTGPTQHLAEGDEITVDGNSLTVLYVPGHAPGHIAFYHAQGGFVLSGDVLFQRSIGRTDLPGGNHETLLQSIREKLFTLPGNTVVYPGHGDTTTIAAEMRENPFLQ